jgi:hypothetical protein
LPKTRSCGVRGRYHVFTDTGRDAFVSGNPGAEPADCRQQRKSTSMRKFPACRLPGGGNLLNADRK